VLALDGMGGNKFLAAWVVPAGGGAGDCEPLQLRALLSASMPDYLVPRVIVVVDALPLTANGKIDRAALRAMGAGPVAPSASYVPPETATQRLIASMWAELLGIERIGLHDDVWTLGWHSLVATQGLARLRETFQVELPFRALLESSTVAQAAEAVARACRGLDVADAIAELAESVMAMSDGEARRLLGQVSRRDEQAEPA
jgi:acyl carrier protein